jgi:hypothetical protein
MKESIQVPEKAGTPAQVRLREGGQGGLNDHER